MRTEIDESQHHELFTSHVKKMKHESEELVKMLESRLDSLTKPLCDIELNNSSYKTLRSETFRALDAAEGLIRLLYRRLNENMQRSFSKIEEVEQVEEERNIHKQEKER